MNGPDEPLPTSTGAMAATQTARHISLIPAAGNHRVSPDTLGTWLSADRASIPAMLPRGVLYGRSLFIMTPQALISLHLISSFKNFLDYHSPTPCNDNTKEAQRPR